MPTGPSPRPFPTFSLHPNCRHTSAHPRSLMPVLLPTLLTFPLHPLRLQKTSDHPRSFSTVPLHPTVRTRRRIHVCSCPPALLPTHFPFPLHKLSAHLPASTLAHAHRSFSPHISNVPSTHPPHTSAHPRSSCPPVLLPTHFQPFPCTHTIRARLRIHAPSCPPVPLPTPSAHVRPSTLAHAHRSFSLPISNFSVAPALSAHIRARRPFSPPISNLSLAPTPSAHVRASTRFPHTFPTYFPCTHTVRTRQRIHARSCPPALLPTHFHLSLAPTSSAHVFALTLADAHRCFFPTHLTFPLHPHRPHTSAHPFLLPISNLFPCTHSVCTRP